MDDENSSSAVQQTVPRRLELDARDWVRDVRLLESRDLLVAQRQRLGREGVLHVLELGGADDRRRDARLVQEPGERDLRGRDPSFRGDLGDSLDNRKVEVGPVEGVQ